MNGVITEQELTLVGGLAFIFIFLGLWVTQTSIPRADLGDFKQAGLALQLSGTKEMVTKALGEENSHERAQLRVGISRDFVFIFSYGSLFAALGLILSQAKTPGAKWLGITSAIFVLGAAAFDLVENYRILQILPLPKDSITDSLCRGVFHVAVLKWLLLFLAIGLQGVILIMLMNWYSVIGIGFIISTMASIAGLRLHQLIPPGALVLGLTVFALGMVLVGTPQKVLAALFQLTPK